MPKSGSAGMAASWPGACRPPNNSPSVTVASAGGVKSKTEASGAVRSRLVNPVENAAPSCPRAKIWNCTGSEESASTAISIRSTRVSSVRGAITSVWASRPATTWVSPTVTSVVGSIASSAWSAKAPGVTDSGPTSAFWSPGPAPAGNAYRVATPSLEEYVHTSSPLRTICSSAKSSTRAARNCSGPSVHTRIVFSPASSRVSSACGSAEDAPVPKSGRVGKPRSASVVMVPESACTSAVATAASNSAGVRSGRSGLAVAAAEAATPPPISARAAMGTSQREERVMH